MMTSPANEPAAAPAWRTLIAPYQSSLTGTSLWQLINTYVPYLVLQVLMLWSMRTARVALDALMYGLILGGVFGWLWM